MGEVKFDFPSSECEIILLNEFAESFMGESDSVGVSEASEGSNISIGGESSCGEGETAKT